MSSKLKCHRNWNVTKTEMLQNLKMSSNKNQNQKQNPRDRHWSTWSCSFNCWVNGLVPQDTNFLSRLDFIRIFCSAAIEKSLDVSFDLKGLRRAVLWAFGMNVYQMWGPKKQNALFFRKASRFDICGKIHIIKTSFVA